MEEIWKTIKEYPNYQVSNLGNVKNKTTEYILHPTKKCLGYLRVRLFYNNLSGNFYVHRLVAQEFLENLENKPTVNHKDKNPSNNNLLNLEWNTMSEQNKHKSTLMITKRKQNNTSKKIWKIDKKTNIKIELYNSILDAAKYIFENNIVKTNKDVRSIRGNISCTLNGKQKSCYGYKWIFDNTIIQCLEGEIWKEIPFHITNKNEWYYVSNFGRYKNNNNIMENYSIPNNYIKVNINTKMYLLHRIIAITFLENQYNKEQVNHIDGNKLNNYMNNLEWVTNQENQIHKVKNGLANTTRKIIQYNLDNELLNEFNSIEEASKYLSIGTSGISKCCHNKLKTSGGYIFKYNFL
jgi:hypothetical protein